MTTTVKANPRRRPAKKTGDPQADRAFRENAVTPEPAEAPKAESNGHKPVKPSDMTNVRVYGPNGIEGGGHFHVHKSGCQDLRKAEYRRLAPEAWGTSALTQYEIVLGIYEDIISENPEAYGDETSGVHELGSSTVTFFPCLEGLLVTLADDERQPSPTPKPAKATPKPEPTAAQPAPDTSATGTTGPVASAKPVAVRRTAKQALARLVAQAIADSLANVKWRDDILAGMTHEDAAKTVSQWTHHLPTGTDEDGKRWWPATLPRPDRSDWK
jgi:hypothetical protein